MLTPQERRLRAFLKVLSFVFGGAIFGYLLPALFGPLQPFFVNLPFVTNSVVKIGVLALLAFFASADVRRFRLMTVLVIAGHVISILATFAVLIWGKTDYGVELGPLGSSVPITNLLWGSIILDGIITAILLGLFLSAERAHYGLLYLWPIQYRALTAIAEVVIMGANEVVPAEEIARNADRYLASFRARSKWIMALALVGIQIYPLLTLRPPLSYMEEGERLDFIKKRFYQDVTMRLVPEFWRQFVQVMIRSAKQLCYLGYYNDPRTFESVGYVPFSKRPESAERLAASPPPPREPLSVRAPSQITSETISGDVVVIGSGAAASILAQGFIEQGLDVLMIERGDYVDPDQFVEDEVEMFSRLYADGALQLTRDFRFQALQGSCVGGTTVVNNAVCFDMPPEVLDRWNDADSIDARLDETSIWNSFQAVRTIMGVAPQNLFLNPGGAPFKKGIEQLALNADGKSFGVVEANIAGCLGCGYCNIGCRYGKKLSMLDTVLPRTQKKFNVGDRDALRIVAGCEAEKLKGKGRKVTSVMCRLSDGRRVEVKGNTFVVAAGAVSSPLLLLRSGAGGKNVGRNGSFNMGSPITAAFDHEVNAENGLQISHYLKLSPSRGYVVETWFNPPVTQALNMPGWFEDHYNNMLRYNRLACAGILVGTESNAVIRNAGLTGREIDYTPTRGDLDKLIDGLILTGEIFLAGGATSVMPSTFKYHEFTTPESLKSLREVVRDGADITIGTGHPMGGCAISANSERGVVDPDFRVRGYDNLFVCDASVFPSSLGVNPQLTVMAIAHYAVPRIVQHTTPKHPKSVSTLDGIAATMGNAVN